MQKFAQAFHSVRAGIPIVDFLADELPVSKSKLKDAMQKGAVWLHREGDEPQRVRRAKDKVKLRDEIHIYYDEDFLNISLPPLRLLEMHEFFSVWIKPEGILDAVNLYGDHLSLERLIERDIPKELDCFYVNPFLGEITGLCIVMHSELWGKALEKQDAQHLIEKDYRIFVSGQLPVAAVLNVDGKDFPVETLKYNDYNNTSLVRIRKAQAIESQLLPGLLQLGFPPLENEQLQCCSIAFLHPKTQKKLSFHL